ncbi:hypothetical protein PAESOLCIP111_05851 [Paenibacillus solanacearum]|uniref:ASCH domain-containing protein n=1 Tax=Paenibacillus solanacearum TaxID=2048548 RepID=A0A916NYR5_9BACL|nr:ASCH domain-containing protein [Paenibacillus solanacearum]CAG7649368.1 hypothetical protein PAESOLCIP111_05851 [Paenibacillus solanacearum]
MKGLLIKSPWIDRIFEGKKTWEIRGSNTVIRGTIALIRSGSGLILGTVDLVDCKRLELEQYRESTEFHGIPKQACETLPYQHTHAWIFANPTLFERPKPYKHPNGAIIWVNLED